MNRDKGEGEEEEDEEEKERMRKERELIKEDWINRNVLSRLFPLMCFLFYLFFLPGISLTVVI